MPAIRLRVLIDAGLLVLALLACHAMGKDLNIDMLSYHLYSAHAFWTGTYTQTFMGAGSQSYINPLGYLPFYWMIQADWNSFLIAAVMTTASAISLMVMWRIGVRWLFAGHPQAVHLSVAGALLGGLSPLFLATMGTSFLDPVQAALFCLCLYWTADGIERKDLMKVFAGALMLGAATGLKLSMAHLALASILCILVMTGSLKERGLRLMASGAGAAVGFLITGGFWAWQLFKEYGNPVFPFANALFKSPDFPSVSLGLDRFAPESWTDVFTLPLRMAALKSGVYAEIAVPDIRFALAMVCMVALLILLALRKLPQGAADVHQSQVPIYLCAVTLAGFIMMVATSGNGRYFMPIFMLVGPLLIWMLSLLLKNARHLWVVLALVLAAQVIHGGSANYRRWDRTGWTSTWIDAEVPQDLRNKPYRYLFTGSESDTFVAAFMNPASSYLMLQGKNPLSPNREGAQRVRRFIEDKGMELRFLVRESETRNSPLYKSSTPDPVTLALVNDDLAAWNLKVSNVGCQYVGITLGPRTPETQGTQAEPGWPREYSLLSCPVQQGNDAPKEFHLMQARLEQLSDVLSKNCPQLFPAPPSFPSKIGDLWFFRYGGSDVVVSSNGVSAALTRTPFGPFNQPIGTIDELMQGKMRIECRRLLRR